MRQNLAVKHIWRKQNLCLICWDENMVRKPWYSMLTVWVLYQLRAIVIGTINWWVSNSVWLCLLEQEYPMDKVAKVYYLYEMKLLENILCDRTWHYLFQISLLDGLKSVLESIRKNHTKVSGKCEKVLKFVFWCAPLSNVIMSIFYLLTEWL